MSTPHPAVIAALKAAQEQLRQAGAGITHLHHAILSGSAIHCWPAIREYLKELIADGSPYQRHPGSTWGNPVGFFYGRDLEAAAAFERAAAPAYDLLDDGSGSPDCGMPGRSLYGLPRLPGWLLECGKGSALLWWLYWLGDEIRMPHLTAKRGVPTVERAHMLFGLQGRPLIQLADGHGIPYPGERFEVSDRPGHYTDEQDDYSALWQAIRDKEIDEVVIYDRNVFLAADVGLGVLIDWISVERTPKAPVEISQREFAKIVGVDEGNITRWLGPNPPKWLQAEPLTLPLTKEKAESVKAARSTVSRGRKDDADAGPTITEMRCSKCGEVHRLRPDEISGGCPECGGRLKPA